MGEFVTVEDRTPYLFGYVDKVDPLTLEKYREFQILGPNRRLLNYNKDKAALHKEFIRILSEARIQLEPESVGKPVDGWRVHVLVTVDGFGKFISRYYQVVDPSGTIRAGDFTTATEAEAALQQLLVPERFHRPDHGGGGGGPAPHM
jgi:hypothetical protein